MQVIERKPSAMGDLFMRAWPDLIPEELVRGMSLRLVRAQKGEVLRLQEGEAAIVIKGYIGEASLSASGKKALLAIYLPNELVYMPVGELIAHRICDVLILSGWGGIAPIVMALRQLEINRRIQMAGELASLKVDDVKTRAFKFQQARPNITSFTDIARMIGASRELVSRIFNQSKKGGI